MFKIVQEQQQYLTYILTDQKADSQIEVVPERGGIIGRWRINSEEILYLDATRFADPTMSIRGGIPILFPICGNLPDNSYTYGDRTYQLKQHGFARDLPWEVTSTATDNCATITLTLNSNKFTLAVYPFEFQLVFTYQLQGNSLKILQSYTNKSSETMPFSAGFHPYFLTQDKSQLEFTIPSSQYFDHISRETHSYTGFDFDRKEIDVAFTSLNKHSTNFRDRTTKRQISLLYSDLFSTLVFWTIKGKDYICLEPWSAPRNALNTGEKLTHLQPDSTYNAVVEINCSNF
ncbi:MAG: aldose epimerase [Pleurocapsa sp.]